MKFFWFSLICYKWFTSVITTCQVPFEERIQVQKDKLYIKYEHQLADNSADFSQTVDTTIFHGITPDNCSSRSDVYCLHWGGISEFKITKLDDNCESYEYETEFNEPLRVIFNVSNMHLYGGDETENQSWPLKTAYRKEEAFVSKGYNSEAVLESIWYTNTGFYVYVAQNVPLFVNFENNNLHLVAKRHPPYSRGNVTKLDYRVCKYENIKVAFEHAIVSTLGKPALVPNYKLVQLPTWSTWAKFKVAINESILQEFADSISTHMFPRSHLSIDDKWESCYGSLTVDSHKFPSMQRLIRHLHSKGYKVTLWVHPFINLNCRPYFKIGLERNYFVVNQNGSVVTQWWNGLSAHIDFTNAEAVDWYQTRLKRLIAEMG